MPKIEAVLGIESQQRRAGVGDGRKEENRT